MQLLRQLSNLPLIQMQRFVFVTRLMFESRQGGEEGHLTARKERWVCFVCLVRTCFLAAWKARLSGS